MAKYISPGREHIPTTTEYTGTLTMMRKSDDKDLKRFIRAAESRKMISIGDDKILPVLCSLEYTSKNLLRVIFDVRFISEPSENLLNQLKKYGLSERRIYQNYETYDHEGYVKHDVEKYKNISKTKLIILQNIVRDSDGNEWKVAILKNKPYYCNDCNDMHDQWEETETYLFKTEEEAEKKYRSTKRKAA
jgi:hypothetical protein